MNQTIGAAAQGAGDAKACREKYWEECGDAEKIDRLRDQLVYMEGICRSLAENVMNLLNHQHGHDGKLLHPLHEAGSNRSGEPLGYNRYRSHRLATRRERGE